MTKIAETKLALNISAAILLKNGEVSMDDISALPFLSEDVDVNLVVDSLLKFYDAELFCNKIASTPFLKWETVVRLKNRPMAAVS